jgi:hypothetical protein
MATLQVPSRRENWDLHTEKEEGSSTKETMSYLSSNTQNNIQIGIEIGIPILIDWKEKAMLHDLRMAFPWVNLLRMKKNAFLPHLHQRTNYLKRN